MNDQTVSGPKSINIAVAEKLATSGTQVVERVVNRLTEVELGRRADALLKAVELSGKLAKDLAKIDRPDVQTFDGDGKVVTETYTKARLEERKKLRDRIAKVEKAFEKATNVPPDYADLFNLKDDSSSGSPTSE